MIQKNEIPTFLEYLPIVVCYVIKNKNPKSKRGRPPQSFFDILVCLPIFNKRKLQSCRYYWRFSN